MASSGEAPAGWTRFTSPAGTWAVFGCTGPCDVATAEHYRRIFSEWLPSSGYRLASEVSLEVYPHGDFASRGYRSEILDARGEEARGVTRPSFCLTRGCPRGRGAE